MPRLRAAWRSSWGRRATVSPDGCSIPATSPPSCRSAGRPRASMWRRPPRPCASSRHLPTGARYLRLHHQVAAARGDREPQCGAGRHGPVLRVDAPQPRLTRLGTSHIAGEGFADTGDLRTEVEETGRDEEESTEVKGQAFWRGFGQADHRCKHLWCGQRVRRSRRFEHARATSRRSLGQEGVARGRRSPDWCSIPATSPPSCRSAGRPRASMWRRPPRPCASSGCAATATHSPRNVPYRGRRICRHRRSPNGSRGNGS